MDNLTNTNVQLRNVLESDLSFFFKYQLDTEANYMAAFTSKDSTDKSAYLRHWNRLLNDEAIIKKTILFNDSIVGHMIHFVQFGDPEVSYWIGKQYWGKGIDTNALLKFLNIIETRPLYARSAKDNIGSIRVLQKCGFEIISEGQGFANGRGMEVEEYILKLK